MKIQLLTLFLLVSLTIPAWARLGETEDQLIARYGKEIHKQKNEANGQQVGWTDLLFGKSGFQIEVMLFNGVSSKETFWKTAGDETTDDEIKTLLNDNAQDHAWNKEAPEDSQGISRKWQRDDGAVAGFESGRFYVKAKELIDAEAAAYKAAHAASLEGF